MSAIPPNSNLEGFIRSMKQGVEGAFKKGVKYGRYLEQQERPAPVCCKKCEYFFTRGTPRFDVLYTVMQTHGSGFLLRVWCETRST